MYIIKQQFLFNFLFVLIVLLPNIFSVLFSALGIAIPSYLFAIILSILILLVLIIGSCNYRFGEIKKTKYIIIFFCILLFSMTYTESVIASKMKFIFIVYNTIIPIFIFALFFLLSKKKDIDLYYLEKNILKISYMLIWFSFFAFILGLKENLFDTRWTLKGINNPIWFSRFIGMLLLIIIYCEKKKNRKSLIYLISILMSLFLLFKGGSRGPLLGIIIIILIWLSYVVSKKKLLLYFSLIFVLLLFGFVFVKGRLFTSDTFSIMARLDFTTLFTNDNLNFVKGNGFGSFGIKLYGIDDEIMYPHNIFLELLFENGFIGIISFSIIIWQFIKSFKPNIISLLVVYFLFNCQLSGDISSNNNLFILIFISIYAKESTLPNYSRKHSEEFYPSESDT